MASDAAAILEFPALLDFLKSYLGSPLGESELMSLRSPQDHQAVTSRLSLAGQAREYLRQLSAGTSSPRSDSRPASAGGVLPISFSGFPDPAPALEKLAIEGVTLELTELSDLLAFAARASDVRQALLAAPGRFALLAAEARRMADFHSLVADLRRKILPSGDLDDNASPQLHRIRREIEKQRGTLLSSLKTFLRELSEDGPQQDEIITIRADRYVVPVRAQRKGQVKGVVHGSSSTGQTLYIEPLESIEMNNELVRLREEEAREVHHVLREMTAHIRERVADLDAAADCMAALDLAFACGRYAIDYDCVIPRFSAAAAPARLLLKDARHPLLDALMRKKSSAVVPLSLTLDDDNRILVISGPNTGGKTVALKTVGLLALMAGAGLPVPASDAEFPRLDRILVDIGDYQSIQESLSTFSAHLLNINSMMEAAGPASLVLLDELGTATDPEEAGALGVAIVDRFRASGAYAIASTHHMAVKAYAYGTPGILSGSMGFDEHSLQPTYQLAVGRPGTSSGLAIAQRLGLPADVLRRARESLSHAHQEIERLLARLAEEEAAASRLSAELQDMRSTMAIKEKEWKDDLARRLTLQTAEWERKLEELSKSFEQRAEQKLCDLESRVASRRPQETKKEAARLAVRLREQTNEDLRQSWVAQVGDSQAPVSEIPTPARDPVVGDLVRIRGFSANAQVRRIDGKFLEVEIGRLHTRVSASDVVEILSPSQTPKPPEPKITVRTEGTIGTVRTEATEINVIGETAEDAVNRVDKFLDSAFLAQLSRVRIIHGSGKGILRRALAELLTDHPQVEKFFPAPQNEGGAGATIVELKK